MWILPAISETFIKCLCSFPPLVPRAAVSPALAQAGERRDWAAPGLSWPCWDSGTEESHGIALLGTGLKATHLLPFTSQVKQAPAQAAGFCPGFSFPPSLPVALRILIPLPGHIPPLLLPCLVRPTGFLFPGELSTLGSGRTPLTSIFHISKGSENPRH